ncbi:FecR domain-containing protein [Phenylobacterium sp.]|uniref:FecR family protein n=1 Tax=Phenylobacterium sp. TaxID=1871053 RepID=UPI00356AAE8E
MTDTRRLSTREDGEAATWFARLGNRAVTPKLLRDFEAWRDNPANDAAYLKVEAFWEASGRHASDPEVLRMTDAALKRRRRTPQWFTPRIFAFGAVTTCGALAVAVVATFSAIFPAYSTSPTEQRVILLQDGSRVHLNVGSKVRVVFSGDKRRILLTRGEAFFDVAHDANRPFIVDAGRAGVRAVGTKFDVRRDRDQVQVTLLEGVVRVDPTQGRGSWTLAPNQQLTLPANTAPTRVATDASRASSWTTGRLVFSQTPLSEAVAEINRYGRHKVDLESADLSGRLVNGVFNTGDTDAFVKGITMLFDLQSTTGSDGTIHLRTKPGAAA